MGCCLEVNSPMDSITKGLKRIFRTGGTCNINGKGNQIRRKDMKAQKAQSIPCVQLSMVISHQKEKYTKYCQLGTGKQDRKKSGAGLERALNA